MTRSTSTVNKTVKAIGVLLFWALVWQLAALGVGQELILPSPISVARTLMELGATAPFWMTAGRSLLNIFIGFTIGVCAGTLLAFMTAFIPVLDALLSPAVRVVRATPVVSFIILALIWLGKARVPAFASALMVTPVIWQASYAALRDTDKKLLEMAHVYHFSAGKTLRLVYIPSMRTAWSAACATAMGLGWKSGIAAEVICQARLTIGNELYSAKIYLETSALFAWTAVVICLSLILENVLARLFFKKRGRAGV